MIARSLELKGVIPGSSSSFAEEALGLELVGAHYTYPIEGLLDFAAA